MSFIALRVIYTRTYFHENIPHNGYTKFRYPSSVFNTVLTGKLVSFNHLYIPNHYLFPYNFCNVLSLDNNVIVYKKN
jgi:hypothetical protein